MPSLVVLALSDSFASAWPALAAECGLRYAPVASTAALDRSREAIVIVAAGGEEARLADAVRAAASPTLEIAAVGAVASHRLAADAMRAGAAEFFALVEDYDLLRSWVREHAERLREHLRARDFAARETGKYRFDGILGDSPALTAALQRAARIIPHGGVTVLISGETGTGKELLARAVHYNGPRREAPFVDVNCAAIPAQLLESELFGHEKGAFTDASAMKPGLFELANGGTLFLDEIGHLPLPLQGKLLRALEERAIRRVGGTKNIPVDVRIIAATHVHMLEAVQRGEFREDLYYRLNVVPLELPPLRQRREDIVPLARHFVAKFAADYGVPCPALSPAAEQALAGRDWPGNVRELRNAVERAVLLAAGPSLGADDFALPNAAASREAGRIPFPAPLDEMIRVAVRETLALYGGNKSETARRLDISRTRLARLLDEREDTGDDAMREPRAVAGVIPIRRASG